MSDKSTLVKWLYHTTNFLCGGLLMIDGIVEFNISHINTVIVPTYLMMFGIVVWVLEVWNPTLLMHTMPFYFNFHGRGAVFLFFATLSVTSDSGFALATGILVALVACVNFAMGACLYDMAMPRAMFSGEPGGDDDVIGNKTAELGDVPYSSVL